MLSQLDLQIYAEAIKSPQCGAIHLTEIQGDCECDTFFPSIDKERWRLWSQSRSQKDGDSRTKFLCYVPADKAEHLLPESVQRQHEEYQV